MLEASVLMTQNAHETICSVETCLRIFCLGQNFGIKWQIIKVYTQDKIAKILADLSDDEVRLDDSTNIMHVIPSDADETMKMI